MIHTTNTAVIFQDGSGLAGLLGSTILILISMVGIFAIVLVIAGFWKTFEKAQQPGWASLIPILNLYFLLKIAGRPAWWLLLYFIPAVNVIVHFVVAVDVGKYFGKDILYGLILLGLVPSIGYILLGFVGDAAYTGPAKPYKAWQYQ